MRDVLCPMKVEVTNDRYYCIEDACAWWILNDTCTIGECSIKTIARKGR